MANVYLYLCFLVVCFDRMKYYVLAGEPLIVTSYREAGNIKEAQEKARVTPDMNGFRTYSGFFNVNKQCGNNLFFWFVPAENGWETAPVLLWLNGDIGFSTLVGMFTEIGPFNHLKKEGFVENEYKWTADNNVLFLDQPVGTGFSFTERGCYAENLTVVTEGIYSALVQFFMLFPQLQRNKLFLTGERNAGHYLLAAASEIDRRNDEATLKMNLVGILIGNPSIDTRCIKDSQYVYEVGLVDEKLRDAIKEQEDTLAHFITKKNYSKAFQFDHATYWSLFGQIGIPNLFNILEDAAYTSEFQLYLRNYKVREQIHVGNTKYYSYNDNVFMSLQGDLFRPATRYLQELLKSDKYVIGLYSGQLDLHCPPPSVPCVLQQLEWADAAEYRSANRSLWYVEERLAGWVKVAGKLFEAVIRGSGHRVPMDQGKVALELISAVVAYKPGSKLLSDLSIVPL